MVKRIPIADLRIGMFIVSIEGPWWSHPFWKSKFLLSCTNDLARLRESGVSGVVIDDSQGRGTLAVAPAAPAVGRGRPDAARTLPFRARGERVQRPAMIATPTAEHWELQRATETVQRSKAEVTRMFSEARLGHAIRPEDLAPLVEDICDSVERDARAILKVTRLKKKNEYTYLHSVAVSALMIALGRQLGLDEATVRELGLAGMLHDVGKMAVPEEILDKPGRLTESEMAVIRGHPEKGRDMLDGDASPIVLDVILHHHEKVDGTGYPDGLSGDRLSLHARMGAVCDVYDAVTSNRPYKNSWTPSDALARMRDWAGHFDPDILDAFMRSTAIYPVGQLVRLRSNRLGLVVTENRQDPTRPIVRTFYDSLAGAFLPFSEVRIADSLKGDAVVGVERGERRFGADWERIAAAVRARQSPEQAVVGEQVPGPVRGAAPDLAAPLSAGSAVQ